MQQRRIKEWAEEDRPREKLLSKGRSALSDAELLAVIIGSGTKNLSAVDIAKEILRDSNNRYSELSKKSILELQEYKGIGEARAISIFVAMEMARRRMGERNVDSHKITCSNDVFQFIRSIMLDLEHEEFHVLFLNRANKILGHEQISKGGISGTVADGKVIFQKALLLKASALILAHNHPSGQLKPSDADKHLTRELVQFGKFIQLNVLDHLIFSENNYFSFADEGLI